MRARSRDSLQEISERREAGVASTFVIEGARADELKLRAVVRVAVDLLKFRLLPLALEVIRKSGTVQEYRKIWQPIGKKGADGMRAAKEVEYWGPVAIVGPRPDKIRVILRRVGTGNRLRPQIKRPPEGGALMCLLFSLPEGLAEQGLRPQARTYANMES